MQTLQQVADALESRRQTLQITYDDLAARAGLTPLATRRALQGTASPRITTLMALADKLGLEVVLLPRQVANQLYVAEESPPYRPLSRVEQLTQYTAPLPVAHPTPTPATTKPLRTSRRVSNKASTKP